MPDLMYGLVKFVSRTGYDDLPPAVVKWVKSALIDTIAVIIAGSSADGCKAVVDMVKEMGGKEESTIPVFGGRVPAALAALASGPMSRARDFGDVHESVGHVSEYVIPASLALAERDGLGGKDFITATALGCEVLVRIGHSVYPVNPPAQSHRGPTWSVWGPTAAAAKLLKLDEEKLWNAMGIAYAQCGAERQCYPDASLMVRVHHGFVSEAGIKSALLAQKGVTGARNILQGPEGGYYVGFEPTHNETLVASGLGERWEALNTSIKPYPCCKCTHAPISAVIGLFKQHPDINPADVQEMTIGVTSLSYGIACEPKPIKDNPQTAVNCQFSVPYTAAVAAVKGTVTIGDFTDESIWDKDVRNLLPRIKTSVDSGMDISRPGEIGGAVVKVRLKGNREYSNRVDYVPGHPNNPLSWNDLVEKLHGCLPYAARPLDEKKMATLVDSIHNLEKIPDIGRLARLLI